MAELQNTYPIGVTIASTRGTIINYQRDDLDIAGVRVQDSLLNFLPEALRGMLATNVTVNDKDLVYAGKPARKTRNKTIARYLTVTAEYAVPTGITGFAVPRKEVRYVTVYQPFGATSPAGQTFTGRVWFFQQGITATGTLPTDVQLLRDGDQIIGVSVAVTWKVAGVNDENNPR